LINIGLIKFGKLFNKAILIYLKTISNVGLVMENLRKYFAEFFGTFVLVFIGTGSAVIAGEYIGFLGIAFAFGLAILAMVYVIGPISGCHINPAVTIAMFARNKIKTFDAIWYIIMQCFGAIFASAFVLLIASGLPGYNIALNGLGQNGYGSASPAGYTLMACFIAEVLLTFIFVLVIFGSTSKQMPNGFAGISIGLTLTFVHIVGIPITGTSVNPARSIGPAVFVMGVSAEQLWLFIFAPIIGAIIAAIAWMLYQFWFEFETGKKLE
jgi:aquaporin Z